MCRLSLWAYVAYSRVNSTFYPQDTYRVLKQFMTETLFFIFFCWLFGDRGSSVVKVLRYKSEGRWFHSRLSHWEFSLT